MKSNGDNTVLPAFIRLLRPDQWVKNGFVFAPLIFTGLFVEWSAVVSTLLAVFLFCLASSAIYIINDLNDLESDRRHPVKSRTRPLASGAVSTSQAIGLLLLVLLVLFAGCWSRPAVIPPIAAYLLLNIAYTYYLKHRPVIDIFCIASGFVLRVYAGALAIDVAVSSWMFVTTFSLALYLAAIKRRQELLQSGHSGRGVLQFYSVSLVDRFAEMSATGALLFYSLFVMTARPELALTIPLVMFGFFRYWYLVETCKEGESPTDTLLRDWQLLCTAAIWIVVSALAVWLRGG